VTVCTPLHQLGPLSVVKSTSNLSTSTDQGQSVRWGQIPFPSRKVPENGKDQIQNSREDNDDLMEGAMRQGVDIVRAFDNGCLAGEKHLGRGSHQMAGWHWGGKDEGPTKG